MSADQSAGYRRVIGVYAPSPGPAAAFAGALTCAAAHADRMHRWGLADLTGGAATSTVRDLPGLPATYLHPGEGAHALLERLDSDHTVVMLPSGSPGDTAPGVWRALTDVVVLLDVREVPSNLDLPAVVTEVTEAEVFLVLGDPTLDPCTLRADPVRHQVLRALDRDCLDVLPSPKVFELAGLVHPLVERLFFQLASRRTSGPAVPLAHWRRTVGLLDREQVFLAELHELGATPAAPDRSKGWLRWDLRLEPVGNSYDWAAGPATLRFAAVADHLMPTPERALPRSMNLSRALVEVHATDGAPLFDATGTGPSLDVQTDDTETTFGIGWPWSPTEPARLRFAGFQFVRRCAWCGPGRPSPAVALVASRFVHTSGPSAGDPSEDFEVWPACERHAPSEVGSLSRHPGRLEFFGRRLELEELSELVSAPVGWLDADHQAAFDKLLSCRG